MLSLLILDDVDFVFLVFVFGLFLFSSSAAFNSAATIVGFLFGAHIICAWFLACFMSLNVTLHKGHMFDVTNCLIGFLMPWLLH